jgi:hypothetical protein
MTAMAVLGGAAVVAVAAAAWYDHRARRRGWRTGVSRTDIEEREAKNWPSWVDDDRP